MFSRTNRLAALAKRISKASSTIETDLSESAVDDVRKVIRSRAKNPTGRYERAVTSIRVSDSVKVHDGGIVYGPWLEGVSSRNGSTSFKGYHQFELSRATTRKKAKVLVRKEIKKALRGER